MLTGKRLLITGAATGIGRGVAIRAAHKGAAAITIADRDEAGAQAVADEVRALGASACVVHVDLRDPDGIVSMVEASVAHAGGLDVLVNNAGIIESSLTSHLSIEELPDDVWDTVMDINVRAVFRCIKAAVPHLRKSDRDPNIINAGSVSGLTGFKKASAYCMSKGAVLQMTRAAAVDLSPQIRVNAYCPGTINTSMANAHAEASPDPAAALARLVSANLIPRRGTTEEMANLICFLASSEASFITGQAFTVDGGMLAWRGHQ